MVSRFPSGHVGGGYSKAATAAWRFSLRISSESRSIESR
jgi:hypothetical protein